MCTMYHMCVVLLLVLSLYLISTNSSADIYFMSVDQLSGEITYVLSAQFFRAYKV